MDGLLPWHSSIGGEPFFTLLTHIPLSFLLAPILQRDRIAAGGQGGDEKVRAFLECFGVIPCRPPHPPPLPPSAVRAVKASVSAQLSALIVPSGSGAESLPVDWSAAAEAAGIRLGRAKEAFLMEGGEGDAVAPDRRVVEVMERLGEGLTDKDDMAYLSSRVPAVRSAVLERLDAALVNARADVEAAGVLEAEAKRLGEVLAGTDRRKGDLEEMDEAERVEKEDGWRRQWLANGGEL